MSGKRYSEEFKIEAVGQVIRELATYSRPAWLRRYSFRIQHRHKREMRARYLQPLYLEEALPAGFKYMGKYIRVNKLKDDAQFNRACTLEYLFQTCTPSGC